MTTTASVELLAELDFVGPYNMTGGTKLIRRNGKPYLLLDEFCGQGDLEGGMMRLHIYGLDESDVATVQTALECPDEIEPGLEHSCTTRWRYLMDQYLGGLTAIGRVANTHWARGLWEAAS